MFAVSIWILTWFRLLLVLVVYVFLVVALLCGVLIVMLSLWFDLGRLLVWWLGEWFVCACFVVCWLRFCVVGDCGCFCGVLLGFAC